MDSLTCLLTSTQDSLVEYGIILLSMKQYDESLDVFREAFQLRQREAHLARKTESAQEAQLKMAKIRHNIGCVNFELGKMEEAKEAYVDAIEQQKNAFGTWTTPFMIMTDTTKPGFLTMASTMCNKGK
jgi:tetratricopeptide (TPR) repeat protein